MNIIINDDSLKTDKVFNDSVDLIITSPPYWKLRDYNNIDGLGLEQTPEEYVKNILKYTELCLNLLKSNGSMYFILDSTYYNNSGFHRKTTSKEKYGRKTDENCKSFKKLPKTYKLNQLIPIPDMIYSGMIEQGWIIRNRNIWTKNSIPNNISTRRDHAYETIIFAVKGNNYYNKKLAKILDNPTLPLDQRISCRTDIINCPVEKFGKHQASFPIYLIIPFILLSSKEGDIVLDPFAGSGTTSVACEILNRNSISIEINKEYVELINKNYSIIQEILKKIGNIDTTNIDITTFKSKILKICKLYRSKRF